MEIVQTILNLTKVFTCQLFFKIIKKKIILQNFLINHKYLQKNRKKINTIDYQYTPKQILFIKIENGRKYECNCAASNMNYKLHHQILI